MHGCRLQLPAWMRDGWMKGGKTQSSIVNKTDHLPMEINGTKFKPLNLNHHPILTTFPLTLPPLTPLSAQGGVWLCVTYVIEERGESTAWDWCPRCCAPVGWPSARTLSWSGGCARQTLPVSYSNGRWGSTQFQNRKTHPNINSTQVILSLGPPTHILDRPTLPQELMAASKSALYPKD